MKLKGKAEFMWTEEISEYPLNYKIKENYFSFNQDNIEKGQSKWNT